VDIRWYQEESNGVPSAIYTLFKLHIFRKKDGPKTIQFGVGPSPASSGLINNFRLNICLWIPKKSVWNLYDWFWIFSFLDLLVPGISYICTWFLSSLSFITMITLYVKLGWFYTWYWNWYNTHVYIMFLNIKVYP